jgi:hypothetical protein
MQVAVVADVIKDILLDSNIIAHKLLKTKNRISPLAKHAMSLSFGSLCVLMGNSLMFQCFDMRLRKKGGKMPEKSE